MMYMNSKPGNDPRRWLALQEYERFTEVMDPPRPPKAKSQQHPRRLIQILEGVSVDLGITVKAIQSRSRKRHLVLARIVFCRRAAALQRFSTPQIGRAINRDHSTVCYLLDQLTKHPLKRWVQDEMESRGIRV